MPIDLPSARASVEALGRTSVQNPALGRAAAPARAIEAG